MPFSTMDVFIVFFLVLLFILILAYLQRLPLFIILILGGIFCGLLAGAGLDQTLQWIAAGLGSLFAAFAIAILSGIVIVRLLADQGLLEVMIRGIHAHTKNPRASAGIVSGLLSVPITCPIVTYALLSPVVKNLEPDKIRTNAPLYVAAACGIVSYILFVPTPFTEPLASTFAPAASGVVFDPVTIPVALLLICLIIVVSGLWFPSKGRSGTAGPDVMPEVIDPIPASLHLKAWAPFIAIVISIPIGHFVLNLSHSAILQFIMLVGLLVALLLAPQNVRMSGFSEGVKTAGIVIFDVCAAGAIGTVMVKAGLAKSALTILIPVLPDILIPFLIAVILATAQGSRVVTAIVSAQVLGTTALIQEINPLPLILMVAAGSCLFCHITDPFFHLIRKTTGDETRTVIRNYTIPLACAGIVLFLIALALVILVFPYHEDAALAMMGST